MAAAATAAPARAGHHHAMGSATACVLSSVPWGGQRRRLPTHLYAMGSAATGEREAHMDDMLLLPPFQCAGSSCGGVGQASSRCRSRGSQENGAGATGQGGGVHGAEKMEGGRQMGGSERLVGGQSRARTWPWQHPREDIQGDEDLQQRRGGAPRHGEARVAACLALRPLMSGPNATRTRSQPSQPWTTPTLGHEVEHGQGAAREHGRFQPTAAAASRQPRLSQPRP